jgi:hypothetical protein
VSLDLNQFISTYCFTHISGRCVEAIGADKLVQIKGHYGVITSSTISSYVGLGSDWDWSAGTYTPAANDDNEIEVLGESGNYYFYITSWDNDEDRIEAEIHNKITLPDEDDEDIGKDGSRGTPSIPAWNSGNWITLGADNNDATADSADILNSDSGSRTDNLMYYSDGEFMYFMYFLEDDPYDGGSNYDYTYAVMLEDGTNTGDFDYAGAVYRDTSNSHYDVKVYQWTTVFGQTQWWNTDTYDDCVSSYCRVDDTNSQEHIAFAIKYSDTLTPTDGDYAKAVIHNADDVAFGSAWQTTRNPSPGASLGDYTTTTAIPEFTSLLMPIASVILVVGYNNRLKRKYSNN